MATREAGAAEVVTGGQSDVIVIMKILVILVMTTYAESKKSKALLWMKMRKLMRLLLFEEKCSPLVTAGYKGVRQISHRQLFPFAHLPIVFMLVSDAENDDDDSSCSLL